MGVLDRALRYLWSPPVNEGSNTITTGHGLDMFLRAGRNNTLSGVSVTEDNVLRIADVWKVVRVLAEDVSKLPLVLKQRDGRTTERAEKHPAWNVIHTQPNPWQTKLEFWDLIMRHILTRGNGYALINWVRGIPMELLPIHPRRVEVKQRGDFSVEYKVRRTDDQGNMLEPVLVPAHDLLHVPGPSDNGVTGLSLVGLLRETLGGNLAATNHGSTFFGNGAKPNAVYQMEGAR